MPPTIYLPEDPDYTLVDSVRDSVRFAHFCLAPGSHGRWHLRSGAVRGDGSPAAGHSLARLEGPGGEANALGGALTLFRWARFDQNHILEKVALGLLDHVLVDGFLDCDRGVWLFRDVELGAFCSNRDRDNTWHPPGDLARVALQMLWWEDQLRPEDPRCARLRETARRIGDGLATNANSGEGWVPAKRFVAGETEGSAGAMGLYVPWLLMELAERGLGAASEQARRLLTTFAGAAGNFAWDMRETRDENSTIGRALAIRVSRRATNHFRDPSFLEFAMGDILPALESRLVREDLSGAPTTGLVASDSDATVTYAADCAECSIACQEASESTGDRDRLCAGVTILRALARVHHKHSEPHGFLPAGLRLGAADTADVLPPDSFTTPLYSNLLHVDAALHYFSTRVS